MNLRLPAILIAVLLALAPLSVAAQDVESTPAVGNADPVQIPSDPTNPIVVEEGATLIINEAPDVPPVAPVPAPQAPVEALGGNNGVFILIGAVVLFVVGWILAVVSGRNPDTAATERLQELRRNEQAIAEARAALQKTTEEQQQFFSLVRDILSTVAPLTPLTSDDELAALLREISTMPPVMAKETLRNAVAMAKPMPPVG